ncbi:hypothetical protein L6164_000153 [Bauhinia variegata]|uniref:Uncharacterized protein n=1 Tax=Bauhinia variegata TaxID=167791 RepID=A0ACB9Q5R9_BAUVA|nr:hypothetical protein L6164_000153 [Bauhinia variegata]
MESRFSSPSTETPLCVISNQYCFPSKINLKVDRDNGVTYKDNNKHFSVKKVLLTLHHRHVLQDAAGNAIVTLYKKKMSMHERWEVYKGENSDSNNLLFSVRESSMFQRTVKWDVFLANNSSEKVCDFRIKATQQACVIYARKDEWIIAEMATVNNGFFEICVNPNIDYAFIASLVMILDTIIKESVDHPILTDLSTGMVTELATAALTG